MNFVISLRRIGKNGICERPIVEGEGDIGNLNGIKFIHQYLMWESGTLSTYS